MTGQKLGDSPNHPAGDRFAVCAKETHVHIQDVLRSNVFFKQTEQYIIYTLLFFFYMLLLKTQQQIKYNIHIGLTWHINQN